MHDLISSSRRWSPGTVLLVAVVTLAGCQSERDDATPSAADIASVAPSASASAEASASPSEAAGGGEEVSAFDIEVGDCFIADGDELKSVLVVDCEQPHTYEAFQVFDHEAGTDEAYPGDDVLVEYADTQCQLSFEEFVGRDYRTSIWYITSIGPTSATWAEADREIICTLVQQDLDGHPIEVTGSAMGSAE